MKSWRVAAWIFGWILGSNCLLVAISAFAADPTVLIAPTGYQSGSSYGAALSGLGDINGDGFGDFAVGGYTWDKTPPHGNEGRVWVYLGAVLPDTIPDLVLDSFGSNLTGTGVYGIGDMNGDGYDDFIVGAAYNGHGLYFGGPSPSTQPQLVTWVYPVSSINWPSNVAGAGDLNGDGYDDVAIADVGRTYVLLGGASPDLIADAVLGPGLTDPDAFGRCVAGAGDVNGDGFDDLIVGGSCHAYLFLGGATLNTAPDIILTGSCDGSGFGIAVAGGIDINGDGYDDVTVGEPYFDDVFEDRGQVYVYFGGASMDSIADAVLVGGGNSSQVGRVLVGIGDMDDDGFGDFMAASATHRVFLFHGAPDASGITRQIVPQQEPGEDFGHIAWAGDLNGDGNAEFLVGAPNNSTNGYYFGRAYAFTGYAHPLAVPRVPRLENLVLSVPNPLTTANLRVRMILPESGPAHLDLLNIAGRRLATRSLGNLEKGDSREISWSTPTRSSGTYFIRLRINDKPIATRKVVFLP